VVRGASQDRDRADRGAVHRVGDAVPFRAAAVLPGLRATGVDGRPEAGRRRVAGNTTAEVKRLEALLKEHAGIDNYVAYVGTGSPRFYLPLDQQLPAASFAQFVVLAKTSRSARACALADRNPQRAIPGPALAGHAPGKRPAGGLPGAVPRHRRAHREVRALARKVAAKVRENPHVVNVHLDWEEPSKVVYLNIDQDRARALGVSTANLSKFLQSSLTGSSVSQYREDNELIEILLRGTVHERTELSLLPSLAVPTDNGRSVALSQMATLEYGFEEGIIWHRNRLPTVTVRADIYGKEQPATLVKQIAADAGSDPRRTAGRLPAGCRRHGGGFGAWAEVGECRHAAVHRGGADVADGAAAQLLAHGDGVSHRAVGADRRDPVPAGVPPAVRVCRDARHHRAVGDDHAQLGDPGGPDRAGHRRRAGAWQAIIEATVRRFRRSC
jgi:hypothetical protein